jgi:septal ring factor EnvC (AmiA/AmiB activator)
LLSVAKAPKKSTVRTSADVRKQRQQTEQQIAKTSRQLTMTEGQIKDRLNRVGKLEHSIAGTQVEVTRLQARLDSINSITAAVRDSIAAREQELARLRSLYATAVRASRRSRREMNTISFLFSSESFNQAYRRMRYLEEYSAWRRRKTDEIRGAVVELQSQKDRLTELQSQTSALRSSALAEQRRLRANRDSVNVIVNSLRGQQKELNTLLKKQEKTLRSLDDEISRLIVKEEQERKAREEQERKRKEAEAAKKRAAEAEAARKAAEASAAKSAATAQTKSKGKSTDKSAAPAQTSTKSATPAPTPTPTPAISSGSVSAGNFGAQRGRLPSPLSHTHVVARRFGVQRHATLSKIEVDNPGVDLETSLAATARAIYPGVVSAVFVQDGYEHVVLIRHGDYLTVYANIKNLSVKKGDNVRAGTIIGTLGPSDSNPSRGLLHFEIRREREKFDPLLWLKK